MGKSNFLSSHLLSSIIQLSVEGIGLKSKLQTPQSWVMRVLPAAVALALFLNPGVGYAQGSSNSADLASCGTTVVRAADAWSFVTVDRGFSSGIRDKRLLVVKAEKEWKYLWQAHASAGHPPKELPAVDFDQDMIVTVFAGEKQSGGYRIEITKIEEDPGKRQLNVNLRESKPPPDAMVIQMLTQPYHIVKLKKADFPVMFVFEP